MLNYKKPAFWVIVAAIVACAVVTVCFATNPKDNPPKIDELRVKYPEYFELGTFKGLEVYVWQMSENDYRFGLMQGTNREKTPQEKMALKGATAEEMALILSTFDIEDKNIFVIPWQNPISSYMVTEDMMKDPEYINNIRTMLGLDGVSMGSIEIDGFGSQKLTLDDVVTLSQKGDALSWSDFEQYQGREVGSGLYIMRYEIDELFDVLVGGVPEEMPMYIRLRNQNINAWVDLREDDVERVKAFIEVYKNDVPKADELSAALNKLEYQPFTCDGLPEYKLYDTDGTVYSINFSEKWVWRGNSEQAELSDELIPLLKESGVLIAGEDTPTPAGPDAAAATLSEEQTAIRQAILEHNKSSNPQEYDVACCSFVTLETFSGTPLAGSNTHKITYYGWALYEEYRVTDNGLETVSGSHVPVALSFDLDERGYTLTEYWEPRDGSYYAPDIREKFPARIAEDALNNQKFILQQMQECYEQAIASTGLDTDKVIGTLLDTICSNPALSSDPGDYIEEHPIEFRELTYYGRYTLKYCFARFEEGGEVELAGHIMMRVCEVIAAGWGEAIVTSFNAGAPTGQMWYSDFKNNALRLMEQYSEIELAERYPASYLLLSILGKI